MFSLGDIVQGRVLVAESPIPQSVSHMSFENLVHEPFSTPNRESNMQ